jgi:integral membrane protein
LSLLSKLESLKPFSEPEAWFLFKSAALAEAVGWTLLIAGVIINHYKWIGYKVAIPIAGRMHGTFFLMYFAILAVTYTSLNWSRKKFIIAIMAGVPPYGTLIFEQITSFNRRLNLISYHFLNLIYWQVTNNNSVK